MQLSTEKVLCTS